MSGKTRATTASSLRSLVREVASFSGMEGMKGIVVVFSGAVVESAGLLLLVPFLTLVVGSERASGPVQSAVERFFEFLGAESRLERLVLLILVFVVLMSVRALVLTMRQATMVRLAHGYVRATRTRLTRQLAVAEWATLSRIRHSRIVHLMGADMEGLSTAVTLLFHDSIIVLMLSSQVAIALYLSPLLAGIALVAVLVGMFTLLPLMERARKFGDVLVDANISLINDVGQFLGAIKLATSQNLGRRFADEFEHALTELYDAQLRHTRRQTLVRLVVTTISSIVGAGAIVFGIAALNVPASILIVLVVIFTRMNGPAIELHSDLQQLAQALPAYEKIRALENELGSMMPTVLSASDMVVPPSVIEFRGVTFLHGENADAERAGGVRSLDLLIEPGQVLGVTGPSGAGKTTFADLLVGLYPPQQGRILIGGIELGGGLLSAWRNQVSYVTQDPFLFHETIRRNLLWANPGADEAAIWHALEIAGAADLVRHFPAGLETVVGDRGMLISGGERQRISLARALIRQPQLLVLDEATNAIDVEGERHLFAHLMEISPRPTMVVIAHRAETLACCERLIVLEDGRLGLSHGKTAPLSARPPAEIARSGVA